MSRYGARISRLSKNIPRKREFETCIGAIYNGTDEEKANLENTIVLWSGDPEIEKHNAEIWDRLQYGDDEF